MKNKWFTMVELVVVITILAILGTISFISFAQYMVDARNSSRSSDMGEIKISLRTTKQRTGAYPLPGNKQTLKYNDVPIGYQWLFDQSLAVNTISKIPKDPKLNSQYYTYSVSANRQSFQVSITNEWDDDKSSALVDGDYRTVSKYMLPSLISSRIDSIIELKDGVWSGTTNRTTFVLNGWKANLSYDFTGGPKINTTLDFSGILNEAGVTYLESSEYGSCQDIYEAGKSIGAGTYRILDPTSEVLTDTGCIMNPPSY
jgi:type II secretory pathway pseudopilin PulG